MKTYRSFSSEETKSFSGKLAKKLAAGKKNATIFALTGELGVGKTTFVQGFFKGLGLKRTPSSPTFIIMRRTTLRHKKFKNIFHIDAYRIKKTTNLAPLEFEKIFHDPQNIVLIEWAENIKKILPKNTIWMKFHHGKKENERTILPQKFIIDIG